jgi:peptidoglycan/xylan/chitin deacetylase (PgdA/CDA1 family)
MSAATGPDRYGYASLPSRPGGVWPGGQRLAVYVCVGVEQYRFGGERVEDTLPDVPAPDLVNTAWRDYGNRVGAFRLFDRLASFGIAPTVLLNTDVYDAAPDVLAAARGCGAEVVGHGLSNSDSLADLPTGTERDYLRRVADRIEAAEGYRPGGWSSPWLTQTAETVDLLATTGYEYLLDLRLDDQPVWLRSSGGPLLAIPYNAEVNDSSTVVGKDATGREFADMIVDEFDELLLAAQDRPLVMSIVLHSFISGVPFRLRALTRALEHLASHREDVWFTRPREIHRAVLAAPETFGAPSVEEVVR